VKKADLVSFIISAKSSSFTFREMSSAPDSLFAHEVVVAVFNPSQADLVLSTRTLGLDPARADIPGSSSAVKFSKASCHDADSECKMKQVDQEGLIIGNPDMPLLRYGGLLLHCKGRFFRLVWLQCQVVNIKDLSGVDGDDNHDGDHPETTNTSPPVPPPTQQIPHTVSSIKLPILKKEEYDIWAMKMEHYLSHTDYPIWQVIQNGNGHVSVTTDTNGMIKVLPLKTAKEVVAKEREKKPRTTLLMALPEDHLAKFHKMADASYQIKIWFQTLLSQLEIYGAGVSHEDANQKFLRVFKYDVKGTTASSSNTQNVSFVSADNSSNTNDVGTAYSVSSLSVSTSQEEGSSSYTDEVIHSFFANQSSAPQLDYDDL
nr:hypothetical protein [Tanacetum cinerariifolium]